VRAATKRVIVELSGAVKAGDVWALALIGLDNTLGVDATMARLLGDLADGSLSATYPSSTTPVWYQATGADTVTSVASKLAQFINRSAAPYNAPPYSTGVAPYGHLSSYTATMIPGRSVTLSGTV